MIKTIFFIAATAVVFIGSELATAQDIRRYEPKTLPNSPARSQVPGAPAAPVGGSDEVLVERLDAVLVLDHSTKIEPQNTFEELEGLQFNYDDSRSYVRSPGFREIVERYLGGPVSLRRLNQMSRDLILFYRSMGRPVVDVAIPEQRITGGTVQIVVIESRVGRVTVEGGCFFDACMLADQIECTQSGDFVQEKPLQSDLQWLNRSPFRRVEIDLKPGATEGETDVTFKVHDVRPLKGYAGFEDTGVPTLGINRLYAGFVWGNAFGRDGQLSYQYTTDANFQHLEAHSAVYQKAWNRTWSWQTYGAWSGVESVADPFSQTGESWQVGSSVLRTLQRTQELQSWLTFGFDFKSTNNNLEFGGTNVGNGQAQLGELNVGYDRVRRYDDVRYWLLANDLYFSPWSGFGEYGHAADFNSIRAATRPEYAYNRTVLEGVAALPYWWQLLGRMTGQVASQRLLWSEMLGYGGYDSIRGYNQRVYNADSGWYANLELGPQTWKMGSVRRPSTLRVFTFFDVGEGYVRNPQPGDLDSQYLSSTGFGLRYNLNNRLIVRFDYGHGFEVVPGSTTNERAHVGVTYVTGPNRP